MASRRDVEQRRNDLHRDLRQSCHDGTLKPGALAPTVRELAGRYGISNNVAHRALQELIREGTLYSVPGIGTFVQRRQTQGEEYYLSTDASMDAHTDPIQVGFCQRIAQRGGATLTLPLEAARGAFSRHELPAIAGIFGYCIGASTQEVPHVGFAGHIEDEAHMDVVSYDDMEGGQQATQHLISQGHSRIAFVGTHSIDSKTPPFANASLWSEERQEGWQKAMTEAGLGTQGLAFHPKSGHSPDALKEVGREIAELLKRKSDITAIVAANDETALVVLDGINAGGVTRKQWPAIVGFDNLSSARGQVLTSLRLPQEELGRTAADLLWERRQGLLVGPPVHRRVHMSLLTRLSCRTGWSATVGFPVIASATVL